MTGFYQQHWRRIATLGILLLALAISARQAQAMIIVPEAARLIEVAEEVGEIVNHGDRNIYLSAAYGKPLRYHGELSGMWWPPVAEIQAEKVVDKPEADYSAEERFNTLYAEKSPEYFIVTDISEWQEQDDLREFLLNHYSKISEQEDYLIFDLKN